MTMVMMMLKLFPPLHLVCYLVIIHLCYWQIHAKTLAFRTPGAKLVAVSDIFEEAGARVVAGCNGLPKFYKVPTCVSRLFSGGVVMRLYIIS